MQTPDGAEPSVSVGVGRELRTGGKAGLPTHSAFTAALGGFLFGYDSAVINGAVTAIGDHYHVSAGSLGFTVSSALLGAAVGAVLAGRVADRFGRLRVMSLAAVLFLISALGAGLVDTLGLLIVFRVIGGIGVGMASVIAPAYIAEIAPASIRGRLGSLQQLAIVLGIFVALLADYLLAKAAGGSEHDLALGLEAWRWMFLAMTVPAVLYGGLALTIPESPRYLVSRMRLDAAKDVVRQVLGTIDVDAKVEEIRQTLSSQRPPKLADLRGPALGLLPIVWVGIGLSVFQIHDAIAAGTSQYGMQTFDQSLFDLYSRSLVTYDEALLRASNPDDFKLRVRASVSPPTPLARKWSRA